MVVDPDLIVRFRTTLSRTRVARDGSAVLVAVSGGADSVALLLLARATLGDRCHAATVDHGLRPAAAAEADFVADLCLRLGVPHRTLDGVLPDRSARTANVSARARDLRYALLRAHAEGIGAGSILTAHHADDQLETVIMRLNRGAGVAGLGAIREENGTVVRPLLAWRHEELAAIVAAAGIAAVDDPSNRDDRFARARLRKELAALDWIDPVQVARSAHHLAEADVAIDYATTVATQRHVELGEGIATFSASGLPQEVKRRVVLRCVVHVAPAASPRGSAVARAVAALDGGRSVTLGGVACSVGRPRGAAGQGSPVWAFCKAPPRRSI